MDTEEKLLVQGDRRESGTEKVGAAIALVLVITVAAICSVTLILLTLAISFNKVTFAEAKDVFSLILVALVALAGTSLGFYLGAKSQDHIKK